MESILGVKTRLSLNTGEVIDGWHYGDTPLGYYIALDPEAKVIRFVATEYLSVASYDHNSPKAQFQPPEFERMMKSYHDLRSGLWTPMSTVLDRLDLNHVRRLAKRISHNRNRLVYDRRGRFRDEVSLPLVLDIREAYEELLNEITDSGVQDILMERRGQIRDVISEFTLPQVDAQYIHPYELKQLIQLAKEKDNLSETNFGKTQLEKLSPDVLAVPEEPPDESKESRKENRERKVRRLRSAAAWIKISTGGGLAAANLTLGALAGVVSALPTLGLGTVAAVVGIATSTYTGLNAASDALKDMASNLEQK